MRTEAQWNTAREEFATDSFTMLNLSARYRVAMLEEAYPVEIGLSARNLLDEEARNAVSFNKDEVLLPGRDVRLSLRIAFRYSARGAAFPRASDIDQSACTEF